MGVRGGETTEHLKKLISSHAAVLGFVTCAVGLTAVFLLPGNTFVEQATGRLALAVAECALLAAMTGWRPLVPSSARFCQGLGMCWYMVMVMVAVGLFAIWGMLSEGESFVDGWPLVTLKVAYLCLSVGLVEEILFRGLVLDLFLRAWGSTQKGVVTAVAVSSLLFGFAHVVTSVIFDEAPGGIGAAQVVLKTVEAAMMGVLLASVVLRTREIWSAAAAHALADFLPLLSSMIFGDTLSSGGYVSSDATTGLLIVGVYCFSVFLSMPYFFPAVESVLSTACPRRGIFDGMGR